MIYRICFPPELVGFLPIEIDDFIGAIKHAVPAPDAFFSIVHCDAVFEFVHGPGGATPDAGRILTVVAQGRNVMIVNIGNVPDV